MQFVVSHSTAPSLCVFVFSPIYARFDNVQKFFARRLHDLCTLHFLFLAPSQSHSFTHTTLARSFDRFFSGRFQTWEETQALITLSCQIEEHWYVLVCRARCACVGRGVGRRHAITTGILFPAWLLLLLLLLCSCLNNKLGIININYCFFDGRLVEIYFIKCEMYVTSHTLPSRPSTPPYTVIMCTESVGAGL